MTKLEKLRQVFVESVEGNFPIALAFIAPVAAAAGVSFGFLANLLGSFVL